MNDLRLHALKCPQCGAPGVVRKGTRITNCERCGVRLCLTDIATSKYEVAGRFTAAQALTAARTWMKERKAIGNFGRPELVLIPYHEISALRVGVFERKVPQRERVKTRTYTSSSGGGFDTVESWTYSEREDTKVMVADVQHLAPAANTPWDLSQFDSREARRVALLAPFDLVEAQRRATVYAEEETPSAAVERRFAQGDGFEVVALSRRTLFFPFWSIPVETESGSFEVVIDGVRGTAVAWRLPEAFPQTATVWAALAIPGALALGYGLKAVLFDAAAPFDPFTAIVLGGAATAVALWRSNRPDWAIRRFPDT